MKFHINNTIGTLIPFKEDHQGLLKPMYIWWEEFQYAEKVGLSPEEGKSNKKITYEEAFQNLLKCYLFSGGSFGEL